MPPLDHGSPPLLDLEALAVRIPAVGRAVLPVRGASLELRAGETLALIGESGSGKSMLGLAVARLLPWEAEVAGGIRFAGHDLLALGEDEMAAVRGRGIAFVPQSTGLALNPCMRAARQVEEVIERAGGTEAGSAKSAAATLMGRLGLDRAAGRMYPHQLSGGMRQRLLLAIGLACRPRLLIADEPTKGIDSRRVEDVVALFCTVRADRPELAMMVITHDLRFARAVATRVAVMYAGDIVEEGPVETFFAGPRHPYSRGLLGAMPEFGLNPIPGAPPPMDSAPAGCAFAPRCALASAECRAARPPRVAHDRTVVACRR
jgi:peptide/nickel transport system ATP-binding protein